MTPYLAAVARELAETVGNRREQLRMQLARAFRLLLDQRVIGEEQFGRVLMEIIDPFDSLSPDELARRLESIFPGWEEDHPSSR